MEISNWDIFWAGSEEKDYWKEPDPFVLELIDSYPQEKFPRVLDLGCGMGRHALAFARHGYEVTAADSSRQALDHVEERAKKRELKVTNVLGDYRSPLFAEGSYDIVICYNVLYHCLREEMVRAINLCQKYLKPGGVLFFTCPTRDDGKYGDGEKIAPHTFLSENSTHPGALHYFSNSEDIDCFCTGFEVLSKKKREYYWKQDGVVNFSSYWQLTAQKIEA